MFIYRWLFKHYCKHMEKHHTKLFKAYANSIHGYDTIISEARYHGHNELVAKFTNVKEIMKSKCLGHSDSASYYAMRVGLDGGEG